MSTEITGILDFLRAAERLKNVTRSAYTSEGHAESVAEHTWRLCLMALVFEDQLPELDFAKLIKICIIHDLGEALSGDVPAPQQSSTQGKSEQERIDLLELLRPLPKRLTEEVTELWDEYEAATSPEAKLAKGLDKLETILQHNQGRNPPDFDYLFNLEYGARYTTDPPFIAAIRSALDAETQKHALAAERGNG